MLSTDVKKPLAKLSNFLRASFADLLEFKMTRITTIDNEKLLWNQQVNPVSGICPEITNQ